MARFLFADDEPWWIQQLLRSVGEVHSAKHVGNTEDAWAAIKAGEFDILVLDIMLPARSIRRLLEEGVEAVADAPRNAVHAGVTLYRRLREDPQLHRFPVVVLSVLSEAQIRAIDPGVTWDCPFLQKGQDPHEILKTLLQAGAEVDRGAQSRSIR